MNIRIFFLIDFKSFLVWKSQISILYRRIAVRNDTCTMVAISLNIQQRVHPIIWTVTSLPFDCNRVLSIKKPIGGCLIVAINSVIYLNQSVPPYGVSLNSIADHSTSFPLSKSSLFCRNGFESKINEIILCIFRATRWCEDQFGLRPDCIHSSRSASIISPWRRIIRAHVVR